MDKLRIGLLKPILAAVSFVVFMIIKCNRKNKKSDE